MVNDFGHGVPWTYDYSNMVQSSVSPGTVHCKNAYLTQYFTKYLLQQAISVFEWTVPEHWEKNYFLYTLYTWGFVTVFKTDRFGVIPQGCSLRGYNVMYQPREVVIANPIIGTKTATIGKNCTLIKLMPDYSGIMDIVSYYADILALISESMGMNLVNSKLSYVFAAGNKSQAETFKKLYDNVASGDCAVVTDKNLMRDDGSIAWDFFNQNVGQNYIVDKLAEDMRKIVNMFCTEIGIPNANTEKKERQIVDEVNANNFETKSKATLWYESLKEGVEKTRKMFNIDETVFSVKWRREVVQNGSTVDTKSV